MSNNPIYEITLELDKTSLKNLEITDSLNYQNIIEKICCDDKKTIECSTHFLTPALKEVLCERMRSANDEKVCNTANFIALLGKYENCREYLSDINLIQLLVQSLESYKLNVCIQACRALANICFERLETQKMIWNEGGRTVMKLLPLLNEPQAKENDPKFQEVLVGLLQNLVAENEASHQEIADLEYWPIFFNLIKSGLKNGEVSMLAQNIFTILVALTESIPAEKVFTGVICDVVVEMFREAYQSEFCTTALEFLEDAELPDPVKLNLAESGLFQQFIDILENKPEAVTAEEANKYDLTGRVLANILTGDDAMEYICKIDDGEILNHLTKWLSSKDKELVHTAVLCIGNIARTDRHSTNIVEKGIHKDLLSILSDSSNDIKIQYAVMSTIRNLSIPRVNKVQLVKDGLINILLPLMDLDVKTSSPVVFKLVGTLRQVIDGQESLAIELGCNEKIVKRLVMWSSSTIHPWVSSECSRFLCWLVKISKDRKVILNVMENGGYNQIMKMLGALHGLMQSESVSALTVTSAIALLGQENMSKDKDDANKSEQRSKLLDLESILIDGDVGEKLKHLLLQHGVKMDEHVLENIFTFLEIVTKFDKVRDHFNERSLKSVFRTTMQSRDDFNRFKYRIEEIEKAL